MFILDKLTRSCLGIDFSAGGLALVQVAKDKGRKTSIRNAIFDGSVKDSLSVDKKRFTS